MTTPTAPTAHEALSLVLAALLARDRRPPCCDGSGRWLSDDEAVRAQATEECGGCPLMEPCRAAGAEQSWGVWGGVDVSVRPTRRRERRMTQQTAGPRARRRAPSDRPASTPNRKAAP